MMNPPLRRRATIVVLATGLLLACERKPTEQSSVSSPVPASAPTEEQVSIIRPDVEVEREPEPMVPLLVHIGFDGGGVALSPPATAALEHALSSEQMKAGGSITLAGHSDSVGSDAANLTVARERGEAVRDWLVEHGVNEARITVVSFGEQNPVAPNALDTGEPNEAGRALNRRVELTIAVPRVPSSPDSDEEATLLDEITNAR